MKNNPSSRYLGTSLEKGRNRKAFTLVELIVVITILAILGTIAFISLQGYSRDARDSTRTADLGNMKTSLELYSLKTGNYPKPDNFSTITYSGGAVWYQGIVGDQVTTNLKSLNEKPLDPLTNDPYTYSVTQSKGEYEILALYEGSVAYQVLSPEGGELGRGLFPQANAATTTLTPKVVGNYNGVYVKTPNYIIPTPSIIISEPLLTGIPLALTPTNIRSQVITNGTNIPKNSLTQTQTGGLTGFNLAVFTGAITKLSPDSKKVEAIIQIQQAYTGSTTLNTKQNIAYILNQTSTGQIVALTDITLLKGHNSLSSNTVTNTTPTPPIINNYTCKTILNAGLSTGSGVYSINPTGIAPFDVYCDMSTDGGGWILVGKSRNTLNESLYNSNQIGNILTTTLDSTAKLSDININNILGVSSEKLIHAYNTVNSSYFVYIKLSNNWNSVGVMTGMTYGINVSGPWSPEMSTYQALGQNNGGPTSLGTTSCTVNGYNGTIDYKILLNGSCISGYGGSQYFVWAHNSYNPPTIAGTISNFSTITNNNSLWFIR